MFLLKNKKHKKVFTTMRPKKDIARPENLPTLRRFSQIKPFVSKPPPNLFALSRRQNSGPAL